MSGLLLAVPDVVKQIVIYGRSEAPLPSARRRRHAGYRGQAVSVIYANLIALGAEAC